MPDRFDHLDRHGLVELAGQVAVILEQHRDPLREPLGGDSLDGIVVLLARNRGGRHAASVVFRRMNREPAPSGADLDQVIVRAQIQLAADAIDLGRRGFLERRVGALEDRARVHQRAIEHQLEKIVAEIIMRRDIALAAGPGVAIEIVDKAADWIGEPREAAVETLGHVAIANHDLDERGQIVGRPRSGHVRFGSAHAAREREVGIEAMIVDANSRAQIGVGQILAAMRSARRRLRSRRARF